MSFQRYQGNLSKGHPSIFKSTLSLELLTSTWKEQGKVMGFQHAFVFLVLLCAAVMVHGQPADVMPRYRNFLRQHVKDNMAKDM
ncbi:hypothetical protein DPEC_G00018470 [Dallia pectoralis]|uniref:Uncharacterized protein n=1 Tax=Dallia pectoralis TaxID=75939 RepID=A0ACC2HFR9_DALPE|nr:hypothetical protein DPEC_G00018470 [Dallia pectoralis]